MAPTSMLAAAATVVGLTLPMCAAGAQVAIHPTTIRPASWERIALRVVNQAGPATVGVRLSVPEAVGILGVESPPGWAFRMVPGGDTAAPLVEWTGDSLTEGTFAEFAVLGRLASDVRNRVLVFPVRLTKADGSTTTWARTGDADGAPPTMEIVGSTEISAWATFATAGVALGVAILALGIAVSSGKRREPA